MELKLKGDYRAPFLEIPIVIMLIACSILGTVYVMSIFKRVPSDIEYLDGLSFLFVVISTLAVLTILQQNFAHSRVHFSEKEIVIHSLFSLKKQRVKRSIPFSDIKKISLYRGGLVNRLLGLANIEIDLKQEVDGLKFLHFFGVKNYNEIKEYLDIKKEQ